MSATENRTIIYQVTNILNGKSYIGLTKQRLLRRWRGHVQDAKNGSETALHRAIRKYGEDAFEIAQIATCLQHDDAGIVEAQIIIERSCKAPNGYNLTSGGEGVVGLPDYIRKRIADKNRGRKWDPEALAKRVEKQRGRIVPEELRDRLRKAHTGKKLTDEHRKKLSIAKTGKSMPTRSESHKQKISEGLRLAWARRKAAA